ncbi:MAG: restriction endonuclease subunit S [Candidatus Thiodiazotropha lotti]|nr:restriction endonuclease subunit S [Candidatus Thiodiazotropha lotti]MCW4219794.1 restriction endonuclease subunit S [Candidatus Thiodiazotropha lotti]
MAGDWTTIGAIAEVFDGPHATPNKIDEGPWFLSISSLENGKLDLTKSARISEDQFKKWTKRVTPSFGDVLFSYETRLGEAALMPEGIRACLGRRMGLLRPNREKVDPRYLLFAYLGPSFQQEIRTRTNYGATVERIALKELPDFPIRLPKLAEQKAIAHILGTLDDKIELNRQMNATLEAMAQALFKSWFVDFDPVIDNALAAGNPIPEPLQPRAEARAALGDQRKPLPEAIQKQFPNRFVFNEDMGWVPEGWEVHAVENAIEINPRVPLKKGMVAQFVDMKALPTSGFDIADVIEKAYSGGAKFQQGDVLFARITPCLENGKTGIVDFMQDDEVGFGSTEFVILRGKGSLRTAFVACLSRHATFRSHCELGMVGSSGRQRVHNSSFGDFFLALPKHSCIADEFDRFASVYFKRMSANKNEAMSLAGLRDTLLPKLFSGQLRIPDAEKQTNEAICSGQWLTR